MFRVNVNIRRKFPGIILSRFPITSFPKPRFFTHVTRLPLSVDVNMGTQVSCPESGADEFITKVQSLPAELYNEIYNLTFTADFEETCKINRHYKPPSILQVNKRWRSALSPSFYRDTIFVAKELDASPRPPALSTWFKSFSSEQGANPRLSYLSKWFKSLSAEQRDYMPGSEFRVLSTLKINSQHDKNGIGEGVLTTQKSQALYSLRYCMIVAMTPFPTSWRCRMMQHIRFHCASATQPGQEVVFEWDFIRKLWSSMGYYQMRVRADVPCVLMCSGMQQGRGRGRVELIKENVNGVAVFGRCGHCIW